MLLLNNFPDLKRTAFQVDALGDAIEPSEGNSLNLHQILIHFGVSKDDSSEPWNTSTLREKTPKTTSEHSSETISESGSFTDNCDDCSANFNIKDLCTDIKKFNESSTDIEADSYSEVSSNAEIYPVIEEEILKQPVESKTQINEDLKPKNGFKISTKLIIVSTIVVVSSLLVFKIASLNKN